MKITAHDNTFVNQKFTLEVTGMELAVLWQAVGAQSTNQVFEGLQEEGFDIQREDVDNASCYTELNKQIRISRNEK